MKFKVFFFLLFTAAIPAGFAQAEQAYRLDHEIILFAEPGDSYIGLFGPDWFRVFEANNKLTFNVESGKEANTPDKLVVGMKLDIPAGTYLTRRALERLNGYEKNRMEAMEAIRRAREFENRTSKNLSRPYDQAKAYLENARKVFEKPAFGLTNYVRAKEMAEESIRYFKLALILQRNTDTVKRLKREKSEVQADVRRLYKSRIIPLGAAALLILIVLFLVNRRNGKERALVKTTWLRRHLDRVGAMENP